MKYILLLSSLVLAACATSSPIPLPNGGMGYNIEGCDSRAECYKKATETCGGAYNIVNETGENILAGTVMVPQYSMMIECRN